MEGLRENERADAFEPTTQNIERINEIFDWCNSECGDRSCDRLEPEDFLNHDACQRKVFHR